MSDIDIGKIFRTLKASYATFQSKSSPEDILLAAEVWKAVLQGYSQIEIEAGMCLAIAENDTSFAPTPGQVVAAIKRAVPARAAQRPEFPSSTQAWLEVAGILHNCGYNAGVEMQKLSPLTLRALGNRPAVELKRMAMTNTDGLHYEQRRFRERYDDILGSPWELQRIRLELEAQRNMLLIPIQDA